MSISQAIRAMESSEATNLSRRRIFRTRQHRLDRLVDLVERLVMAGVPSIPETLSQQALGAIADVPGGDAEECVADVSPAMLLDHLLIAEGRLRQDFYGADSLDVVDC